MKRVTAYLSVLDGDKGGEGGQVRIVVNVWNLPCSKGAHT